MDNTTINVNQTVYIVKLHKNPTKIGGPFNSKNYEVLEAKIIEIYKKEVKIEFKGGRRSRVANGCWFNSEIEANQYSYMLANDAWRENCATNIKCNPPEQLLPTFIPRPTGNPLRSAERNLAFIAQGNVFGSEINEQKIIQLIAMTTEDIEMLLGILKLTEFMNDYAKKLIGKYMIIELNSIFNLLRQLGELNKEYAKTEYKELLTNIKQLEEKYKFRFIRDKIAAHKDGNIDLKSYVAIWNAINYESLTQYWIVLMTHIEKVLMKYYQDEKKLYFLMRQHPLNLTAVKSTHASYIPFSDIEV